MITRGELVVSVDESTNPNFPEKTKEVSVHTKFEALVIVNGDDTNGVDRARVRCKDMVIHGIYGDLSNRLRELYWMVITDLTINADRTEIERRFRELSRMMDGHKPEPTGESK